MAKQLPKLILRLYYILILLTPWIMYSGTSELFELNKIMFIYIIAILVAVCMAIDFVYFRRSIKYPLVYSVSLLVFFASQFISLIFSIDKHTSLVGYYGRFNGGVISITAYILLFFGFIQYFDEKSVRKFLTLSVVSSLGVILWGIPGRYGYDLSCLVFTGSFDNSCWTDQFRPAERMFSTLGQPNWLGSYLAIHFFIGVYYLLTYYLSKHRRLTILFVFYTLLIFVGLLFTKSRSSLLAVGVALGFSPGLLFMLGINRFKNGYFYKVLSLLTASIIVIILIEKTGIPQIDNLITRPSSSISQQQEKKVSRPDAGITDSLDIRKIVWQGAVSLGKQYPLFGTGVETFAYSYYFVRPIEHNLTSEWDFLYNKAHNEFLNYLATTGYIGLGGYLMIIIAAVVLMIKLILKTKRDKDQDAIVLIYSLLMSYISIQITNFFGFSTTTVQLFFYLVPAIAAASMSDHSGRILENRLQKTKHHILKGMVLAIGLYCLFYVVNAYRADLDYAYSDRLVRAGDHQSAASLYSDILGRHYEHVYEDKLSFILANLAYSVAKAGEPETGKRLVKLSKYYNEHSLSVSRRNILYMKTAIKNAYLYYQIDQDPQVLKDSLLIFDEARKIAPTDPKIPYSESLFYSLIEDEEKDKDKKLTYAGNSLDAIDRAIKLKSNYYDAYFLKAQLLKKYNNKAEAKKIFQYILDTFGEDNEEVKKELKEL